MAVVLNKEQIMEIIPHRDPFLLIDEVNELEVGKRVKATKYIKAEDFLVQGTFPELSCYPRRTYGRDVCAGRCSCTAFTS